MDGIAAFTVEGRKNHMSYGQYVRAVERGEFAAPKVEKKKAPSSGRSRECSRCGDIFEVLFTPSGRYSQAKLWTSCLKKTQIEHGSSMRKWSEFVVCKKCGVLFKRERYPSGRLMNRCYCSDCSKGYY